ncbi:hypothetical protein F3114_26130 (plasmid) [Citrobacter freundii]|nr:hypothetical protein F3113_25600 [Citrobacter freundii]QNC87075.1 hypothetical protein F3109_26470 [Klebsiella quasipneumoniae]QNC91530.1 hypothetical protein F3052_23335 [Escherichia coli]QNC96606.1 hypothetical protein F3084_25450 [Citrobacter freundii]QND01767.1 hypothetical protein F3085_25700 [Citrobacter freundii]
MGSCAAPSAKGDDKFITTDYLQQCQPVRGFKSIPTAYATIKGFEVMRALRKGQARPWCLQPGIRGEVRLVERAFGIGPSALTEAMGMLNHHFAAAA